MPLWSPDELSDPPAHRRGCGCLLTLALLLGIGGGGAWWLGTRSPWASDLQAGWSRSAAGQQIAALRAEAAQSAVGRWLNRLGSLAVGGERLARLAPADTPFYAELAPSTWQRLSLYGWRMRPAPEDPALAEPRRYVKESWGLDWETDVAPWLDPDLGVLGRGGGGGTVWLASHDDAAAGACLVKVRARAVSQGASATSATFGRTTYDVITPAEGDAYALALLDGFVVAASPPAALEPMIAQVEHGGLTLAGDNPRFQRLAATWPSGAPGRAFLDLVEPDHPPRSPGRGLPPAEAMGMTLSGGRDWMTLAATTAFTVSGATAEEAARWREVVPALDMGTFDRLPDSTVLALGTTATPETREWLAAPLGLSWAPLGGGLAEGAVFTGLLSGLGTMQGPFAVGLVAAGPEVDTEPVGAVLAVRPADPAALGAELERAAQKLTAGHDPAQLPEPFGRWAALPWVKGLLPKLTELGDETHRGEAWKVLRAGGQPLAGWTTTRRELVLAGGTEALHRCQADDFRAISRAPGFHAVRGRLPGTVGAFAFADGPNLAHLVAASPWLPAKYAARVQRALAPLVAVGAAAGAGIDAEGFHQSAFTVQTTAP